MLTLYLQAVIVSCGFSFDAVHAVHIVCSVDVVYAVVEPVYTCTVNRFLDNATRL